MKRLISVLGVFALLGTLFVIAASSPANADNEYRECRESLGIDRESFDLLKAQPGFSVEACCIDYDTEGVLSIWEPYRCAPFPCQAELGTEVALYLEDVYGDLFDQEQCCITTTLANDDLKYVCPEPEPTPEPTPDPTETPTVEPTPTPTSEPPEVIVVEVEPRPTLVSTEVIAFTG